MAMLRAMSHALCPKDGPQYVFGGVTIVAAPNGCTPPQPSSVKPPAPPGSSAMPRTIFQFGQYGAFETLMVSVIAGLQNGWIPPNASIVAPLTLYAFGGVAVGPVGVGSSEMPRVGTL